MQKVILIVLLVVLTMSCSVFRNRSRSNIVYDEILRTEMSLNEIKSANLTVKPFIIQKAEIELTDNEQKRKLFATIKFNLPDSFLISVRSTTGIEIVRIFLTNDTILINDRINRILYYGSSDAGKRKYGFSNKIFPVIFGDVVVKENNEVAEDTCIDGVSGIESYVDGYRVDYSISCSKIKPLALKITGNINTKPVYLKYYDYERLNDLQFPARVIINNIGSMEEIIIRYSRVDIPWDGDINFIPGSNYEYIEIK